MKKCVFWQIILLVGMIPFAAPFLSGIYMMQIETWKLFDWIVMYSFIYWPTYLIGIILVIVALVKLLSGNK